MTVNHVTGNVGLGTATPQSKLDIVSYKGALIVPRMTTAQVNAIPLVNGYIVYNTTTDKFNFIENDIQVEK